jgi:hypothetical protein
MKVTIQFYNSDGMVGRSSTDSLCLHCSWPGLPASSRTREAGREPCLTKAFRASRKRSRSINPEINR